MNRATGANRRGHHQLPLRQPVKPVAYDPSRLSPGAIDRLVHTAAYLAAAVQGLDVEPGINQPTAAKVLQEPLMRMQLELAAIGLRLPGEVRQ